MREADVPVISLFTGAGGFDLGVEDSGGQVRACVEPDPDCVATLVANRRFFRDARIINRAIEDVSTAELLAEARLKKREAALLVGGPPCQPFSKSAYWLRTKRRGVRDRRASLLDEFLRVLRESAPEAFILENVASLTHPEHRQLYMAFQQRAHALGYAVNAQLVHAVEYGVPQVRARVFVLGRRGKHPPTFPRPTHWWYPRESDVARNRLRSPETAGRWIAPYAGDEHSEEGERLKGRWSTHLKRIPPGWNYKYLTAWAGHTPVFIAETRYWNFLLKLSPVRPSWTIQANPGPWTGPLHWTGRRLRIPERAALQTFPASYKFRGPRRAQVRQIGNAVPCLLASVITQSLLSEVLGRRPRRGRRLRFGLPEGHDFDWNSLRHRGTRW